MKAMKSEWLIETVHKIFGRNNRRLRQPYQKQDLGLKQKNQDTIEKKMLQGN